MSADSDSSSPQSPPSGSVSFHDSVKNLYHIAAQSAYRALGACARQAAQELTAEPPSAVILVDRIIDFRDALLAEQVRSWLQSQQLVLGAASASQETGAETTRQSLSYLTTAATMIGSAATPINTALTTVAESVKAVAALTDSVSALLGKFKSDYLLYRIDVTIDQSALVAALTHHLCANKWKVWRSLPAVLRSETGEDELSSLSSQLQTALANFITNPDQLATFQQNLERLVNSLAPSPSTTTDSASAAQTPSLQLSPLLRAILSEQLPKITPPVHQLAVRVLTVGSDMIWRRNLFSTGRLLFIGGCAIEYTLATADGCIIAANVAQATELVRLNLRNGKYTTETIATT